MDTILNVLYLIGAAIGVLFLFAIFGLIVLVAWFTLNDIWEALFNRQPTVNVTVVYTHSPVADWDTKKVSRSASGLATPREAEKRKRPVDPEILEEYQEARLRKEIH